MHLKFSGKLQLFRRMKGLKIGDLAKLCGVSDGRMEDLLEGRHEPGAADVLRIQKALGIQFDPEDFEQDGMP